MSPSDRHSNGCSLTEEQQAKIIEIRKLLGPLPEKSSIYCSDDCIARYLVARNWNVHKALKMLRETLAWRLHYKPEEIRWEEVAEEARTGKLFGTKLKDRYGRSILVMRPGYENTKSVKGQIRYLVYCMENAIMNLEPGQSQMVWWIDHDRYKLSNISFKATKETAHVLQEHYPERLGVGILYNPPKVFDHFWKLVRPLLDPKTRDKVNLVYSDDPSTTRIVQDILGVDSLNSFDDYVSRLTFDFNEYAARMREDDIKVSLFWNRKQVNGYVLSAPRLTDNEKEAEKSKRNGVVVSEIESEEEIAEMNGHR
ncbi:uncharacterized protein LOC144704131 [Wolffia australiana]